MSYQSGLSKGNRNFDSIYYADPISIPEGYCMFQGTLTRNSSLPEWALDMDAFTHDGIPCGKIRDCVKPISEPLDHEQKHS